MKVYFIFNIHVYNSKFYLNKERIFYLKRSFSVVFIGKFVWIIQIVLKTLYEILREQILRIHKSYEEWMFFLVH